MNSFQRSVGMTPTIQKSAPRKCWAPDMPHDSGCLPDMCWCHTGVEAMCAMSEAMNNSFSAESGPVVIPPASPEQMTKAMLRYSRFHLILISTSILLFICHVYLFRVSWSFIPFIIQLVVSDSASVFLPEH